MQNEVLMWQMAKETPLAQATWCVKKKHPNGNGIGSISQSKKQNRNGLFTHCFKLFDLLNQQEKMVFGCDLYRFLRFFFSARKETSKASLWFSTAPAKPVGSSVLCVRW